MFFFLIIIIIIIIVSCWNDSSLNQMMKLLILLTKSYKFAFLFLPFFAIIAIIRFKKDKKIFKTVQMLSKDDRNRKYNRKELTVIIASVNENPPNKNYFMNENRRKSTNWISLSQIRIHFVAFFFTSFHASRFFLHTFHVPLRFMKL